MKAFKYDLEKWQGSKSKHICPSCGKKTLVKYSDAFGNYLGDDIGLCDRIQKCGYHKPPTGNTRASATIEEYKPPTPLMQKEIIGSIYPYDNLYKFLITKFDEQKVLDVYRAYKVRATDLKWAQSTIFYQIDERGKTWSGKIMNYDEETGKRVKKPWNRIYWVHKLVKRDFVLEQHLFGEHLITDTKRVILVESEKTALICAIVHGMEKTIFVANGGMNNVNSSILKPMMGLTAYAIPDKGAFEYWTEKLTPYGIKPLITVENLDLIKEGEDIADYYLITETDEK